MRALVAEIVIKNAIGLATHDCFSCCSGPRPASYAQICASALDVTGQLLAGVVDRCLRSLVQGLGLQQPSGGVVGDLLRSASDFG